MLAETGQGVSHPTRPYRKSSLLVFKAKQAEKPEALTKTEQTLLEIRDLLSAEPRKPVRYRSAHGFLNIARRDAGTNCFSFGRVAKEDFGTAIIRFGVHCEQPSALFLLLPL